MQDIDAGFTLYDIRRVAEGYNIEFYLHETLNLIKVESPVYGKNYYVLGNFRPNAYIFDPPEIPLPLGADMWSDMISIEGTWWARFKDISDAIAYSVDKEE